MIVRRIFAATTAVFTVAGVVTACSGVPNITFGPGEDEGDGGAVLPDGAPNPKFDSGIPVDGNVADTATDTATDASADTTCVPSNGGVEDCDDGLDNDCNGKVDCEDPACTPTHVCIPTPPTGWSLVAESDNTRPGCPTDYSKARDIELVAGTGTGTCSCACALTNASEACNLQQSSVQVTENNNVCTNNATGSPQTVAAGAVNCTALPGQVLLGAGQVYGKTTAPTAPPSGCSSNVTPQTIPSIMEGRTCSPAATPAQGGGCGVGKVCVVKAPAGLNLCVEKSGANACPATYTSLRSAGGATLADGGIPDGGATTDSRVCRSCSCSSPTCTNATVTLYENANCSGGTTGALPSTCTQSTNKNFNAQAYKSAVTMAGCQPNGFNNTTTGSVTFTDPSTICCQ